MLLLYIGSLCSIFFFWNATQPLNHSFQMECFMQQKIDLCRLDPRICITNLAWFGSVVPAIFGLQIIIQFYVAAVYHFVELLAHCWWGCMVFIAFSHCVLEWVSFITQTCYHSILLTYPRSSINSPQTFSSVQFNWITYCLLELLLDCFFSYHNWIYCDATEVFTYFNGI